MKKINQPKYISQYRLAIGNNTNWHDKKQGDQRTQNMRIENIARQPGSNKENQAKIAIANLLVSMIGSVINVPCGHALLPQRVDTLSANARIKYADSIFIPQKHQYSLQPDLHSKKKHRLQKM